MPRAEAQTIQSILPSAMEWPVIEKGSAEGQASALLVVRLLLMMARSTHLGQHWRRKAPRRRRGGSGEPCRRGRGEKLRLSFRRAQW